MDLKRWGLLVVFAVLILTSRGIGQQPDPWLLAFPEISSDSQHVYFSNDEWTGYYFAPMRTMYTVARDTLEIPEPSQLSDSVHIGSMVYAAANEGLSRRAGSRKPKSLKLPKLRGPELEKLTAVLRDGQAGKTSLRETLYPLTSSGDRVWFGMTAADTSAGRRVSGLGWYDTKRSRFSRVYDPSLAGYSPQWIGVAADTVYAYYVDNSAGTREPRLMQFSIASEEMSEFSLTTLGLASETVQSVDVWADTLLLTTRTHVIIRRPDARPEMWNTRTYASRDPVPLYLLTFGHDTALAADTVHIQTLPYGKPVAVRAWVGEWMELTTLEEIRGYVDDATWRENQTRWAELAWNCPDSTCFARVYVPVSGSLVAGDIIHTPIQYQGKDNVGIRVTFQAAWARQDSLLPVLMPR